MPLRTTFGELISMVRDEAGLSSNSSAGNDQVAVVKRLIRRHYYTLADTYDWQYMKLRRNSAEAGKIMAAGQRFYDFPVAVNPLKISKVHVKWSTSYIPVEYGIDHELYNSQDSEADERADPVIRWDFNGHEQFEVWPIPASDGGAEIRFEGMRAVELLVGDLSRADIDDELIVLYASAEILDKRDKKSAATKFAMAKDRLGQLRAGYADRGRYIVGGGALQSDLVPRPGYAREFLYVR